MVAVHRVDGLPYYSISVEGSPTVRDTEGSNLSLRLDPPCVPSLAPPTAAFVDGNTKPEVSESSPFNVKVKYHDGNIAAAAAEESDMSDFDEPDPNDLSFTAGKDGWVHKAPSNDKVKLKAWFTNVLQDGDGTFDQESNGNFCVHESDRTKGAYVLGIVYRQKMTVIKTVHLVTIICGPFPHSFLRAFPCLPVSSHPAPLHAARCVGCPEAWYPRVLGADWCLESDAVVPTGFTSR